MRKGSDELCKAINKAIEKLLPREQRKELAVKYFGEDFADNVTLYK